MQTILTDDLVLITEVYRYVQPLANMSVDGAIKGWVSDNGDGFPEELLAKVFNKAEIGPESDVGMGLGLTIVKTRTEAHGGSVAVESEKDFGSTFRFRLPCIRKPFLTAKSLQAPTQNLRRRVLRSPSPCPSIGKVREVIDLARTTIRGRSLPVVMTLIRSDAGYERLVGEGGSLAGARGWLRWRL